MNRLLRLAIVGAASMIAAGCSSGLVTPSHRPDTSSLLSRGCEHFSRHQYEVCYAYLVNDSLLARVPYYEVGRQPVLGSPALARLKSRYYGPAQRLLIGQTKGWPSHVDVSPPRIQIIGPVSVSANLATATIHTIETWMVRAEPPAGSKAGRLLFAETDAHHTVRHARSLRSARGGSPTRRAT